MARVLIVDDALYIQRMLTTLLSAAGHTTVATAANGKEGLRQYMRHQPDLVVLDINMPEMDGITMLKALRSNHPEARVVMCTALAAGPQADAARSLGVEGYVCKPVIADEMVDAVAKALATGVPAAA